MKLTPFAYYFCHRADEPATVRHVCNGRTYATPGHAKAQMAQLYRNAPRETQKIWLKMSSPDRKKSRAAWVAERYEVRPLFAIDANSLAQIQELQHRMEALEK